MRFIIYHMSATQLYTHHHPLPANLPICLRAKSPLTSPRSSPPTLTRADLPTHRIPGGSSRWGRGHEFIHFSRHTWGDHMRFLYVCLRLFHRHRRRSMFQTGLGTPFAIHMKSLEALFHLLCGLHPVSKLICNTTASYHCDSVTSTRIPPFIISE